MRRLSIPALVLGLLALPLAGAAPAQAVPARVQVKITIVAMPSVAEAEVATPLTITGRVAGPSVGTRVVLQKKEAKRWVAVKSGRVTARKRYTLRTKVAKGATTYRVKALRSKRIKVSASRTFRVVGSESVATPNADQVAIDRILADTNAFRAENGMAALKLSSRMTTVARNWSQTMATTGVFTHNPDYSTQIPAGWRRAAENIAAGYSLESVVQGWIASPGHRANMLGDFTHIGIGYVSQPGTKYTRYYTQVFAKY